VERPTTTADTGRVDADALVFSGRSGNTSVALPRFDAPVSVDGQLGEPQWQGAARLTGFSQFNPVDGRAALDSTVAFVWYGPDAIYFGARAYAPAGTVRGTLADRDRIQNDDHIQFILDTFNDRRQAFVFAVNPLGVQSDGIRTEGGFGGGGRGGRGGGPGGGGGGGGGFSRANLGNADLNQDMIWQSKGRITEFGYEVELRVPFKSIRYRGGNQLHWGLNVVRNTQRNNYQDTWTQTSRGQASFLIQSGRLTGIHDLKRGLVLDVTPVVTTAYNGAANATTGEWRYEAKPQLGGDVRWGVTSNLTLNGTINPDFSQVEADVGQIPGDVRFALFFPELRPFFVEGSEQIDTPNQLVYTRRIVQPVAAAKLTGKLSRFDVGVLSAVDNAKYSASGEDHPLFNVVRVRRDLGAQNNIGFTITDRREGSNSNQVLNADGRFLMRNVYALAYQVASSRTREEGSRTEGAVWEFSFDRTGRNYGFRNSIEGASRNFSTRVGFVPRLDYVQPQANQRYTWFGKRGALVEQVMTFASSQGTWIYGDFFAGGTPLETRLSLSTSLQFRGGWSMNINPSIESFAFQASQYDHYYVERDRGTLRDTVPFTVGNRVPSRQLQLRVSTPQFQRFGASISTTFGKDAEFLETSQAKRMDVNATLDLRPTPQVRVNAIMLHQEFRRVRDNSTILQTNIPRLRVEYQLNRSIFFRFVGQYESRLRDAYRDPRTENPILLRDDETGAYTRTERGKNNNIRGDWLFSYFPSPGKVLYLGYGASLSEDTAFRFQNLERSSDGFFVKLSWLYRVP
jgi:hypothetical protein